MKTKQVEDLLEIDNNSFDLNYINLLIYNKKKFEEEKKRFEGDFYSTLLRSITHETYSEEEAKTLYYEIINHLEYLNKQLKRDVGIVVASIDYLSNIKNIMEEPIIIEEEKSDFITENSTKDELTNLYLRDIFDIFLDKSLEEAKRDKSPLSLMMIDIDNFKKVNDTYGHLNGDKVLKKVGELINKTIRKMDFAARYGGEELCIIMPNTTSQDAILLANRIREKISQLDFEDFKVTVSIGVSQLNKKIFEAKELIKNADELLYKAKATGKNKVCSE